MSSPNLTDAFKEMLVANGYTGALPNAMRDWLNDGAGTVKAADSQSELNVPTNGFTYVVPDGIRDVQLNPAGLLLTGSIVLPSTVDLNDGFQLTIGCTFAITALGFSVGPGGATISGAAATIAAAGTIRFKYYKASNTWYRR